MGKRGPQSPGAAYPAGWGFNKPPVSRVDAEAILGDRIAEGAIATAIPPKTWQAILEAYHDYAGHLVLDHAPAANRNPNDADGYATIRRRALARLRRGQPLPGSIFPGNPRREREMFEQFGQNAELAALDTPEGVAEMKADPDAFAQRFDWRVFLRDDPESCSRAAEITEAAAPRSYPRKSIGSAGDDLIRRVYRALRKAGLPTEIRGGGERPGTPTPFERLMEALWIEANSPKAFSARLRRALNG